MKKIICTAIVLTSLSIVKAQGSGAYNYKLDGPFTSTQATAKSYNALPACCKYERKPLLRQ